MNPVRTLTIVSIFASVLAVAACDSEPSDAGYRGNYAATTKVITKVIQPETIVDEIQAPGTTTASESVGIKPRISGVVTRVAFEECRLVRQSDE